MIGKITCPIGQAFKNFYLSEIKSTCPGHQTSLVLYLELNSGAPRPAPFCWRPNALVQSNPIN